MAHPAVTALRDRLAAHSRDQRVKMVGLDSTLQLLQAAMDEIERNQVELAKGVANVSMNLRRLAEGQPAYADDLLELERRMLAIAGGR